MLELISIHVPKTGGTSFREILFQIYEQRNVKKINRNELPSPSFPVSAALLDEAVVLHGHLHYEQVRQLHLATGARLVTWLREPVERVFSNYCFRLRKALEGSGSKVQKETTLEEFARRQGQRNQVAGFLSGISLRDFFFVGLTEYFRADIQELGRTLGWAEFDAVRVNVNTNFKRKVPPPSPRQRKLVRELNQHDVALYQEALALRSERLSRVGRRC